MFQIGDRVVWVDNGITPHLGTVIRTWQITRVTGGIQPMADVEWDNPPYPVPKVTPSLYTTIFSIGEYNARMGTNLQ
jgi:hypothetical protein